MICIKIRSSRKWHMLHHGQPLCGVKGREIDRRELGLAGNEESICCNCDHALRGPGRATRLARKLKAAASLPTVYRPNHRVRFEMSVTHVKRTSLPSADQED